MRDDEFLRAFFDTTLPPSQFHHRDHLRLTWLLVRRHGFPTACDMIRGGIQRYATAHGVGAKYHETLTIFWVRTLSTRVRTSTTSIRCWPHSRACSTSRCRCFTGGRTHSTASPRE